MRPTCVRCAAVVAIPFCTPLLATGAERPPNRVFILADDPACGGLGCTAELKRPIHVYLPHLSDVADERQFHVVTGRGQWFR